MSVTPVSLLERIKQHESSDAWSRFVELYTPLIYYWGKKFGMPTSDVADFVQDVFAILVNELPKFEYKADRRFRGWLWTVALNKYRERLRRAASRPNLVQEEAQLDTLARDDHANTVAEEEYRTFVVDRALRLMKSEFSDTTWRACWESVVNGRATHEVAAELGLSANSVHIARSRVLRKLRHELAGLLDE